MSDRPSILLLVKLRLPALTQARVETALVSLAFLAGVALLAAGAAFYSLGAGLVVAGALLLTASVLYARGKP